MDLREALQAIFAERGRLTPVDVVDEARNPEHPLHNRFEWDDSVAGESWRRVQARDMIRSVKVAYADRAGKQQQTPAFVCIRQPIQADAAEDEEPEFNGGYRYLPIETVARDEVLARQALDEMERQWRTLRKKYECVAEFWDLVRRDLDDDGDALPVAA